MGLYVISVVSTTDVCIGLGGNKSNSELRDTDMVDDDSQTYLLGEHISFCKPRFLAAFLSPLRDSYSSCLALATSPPELTDQILSRLVQTTRDNIPMVFIVRRSGDVCQDIAFGTYRLSPHSLGTTPEDRYCSLAKERVEPRRWVLCRRACLATPPRDPPDEGSTAREDPLA